MRWFIIRLIRGEDAATAVEYAVMLALILLAILASIGVLGAQSGGMWGGIEADLNTHGFGS